MNAKRLLVVVCLSLLIMPVIGCGSGQDTITAEELGTIGAKIYQQPDRANRLLDEHDLSRNEFERRVSEVTSDPNEAKKYHRSFRETLDS